MRRATYLVWQAVLYFMIAAAAEAQSPALERVKSEAAQLQAAAPSASEFWNEPKAVRDRSAGLHVALRDWIELLLPKSRAALDSELLVLNARLHADLQRSNLIYSGDVLRDFMPGSVSRSELARPPEDPDKLAVIVGLDVPCGDDDVVYIYDYSQGEPRRVLESHGTRDYDESVSDVRFSKRDAIGNQLILTLRYGAQCGSSWNTLSYDLFRLDASANAAAPILGGQHGIWFGADHPYRVLLHPDELLMEVRDRSIDAGIHNRAHVLRFKATGSTAERIDPVAVQPQDFVDEWLTREWSEMESRSAEGERDKLKKWHEFLAGDFIAGDFQFAQECREKTSQWQIGVGLNVIEGKELPEALTLYFLVQQLDQYRFQMVAVSFNRQEGCPGESVPNSDSPTLFPASQRKLIPTAPKPDKPD